MKKKYDLIKPAISFLLVYLMHLSAFAQERTITGTVTAQEDGAPIPGASVLVKGTNTGTVSDFEGNYKLDVTDDAVLAFTFVGFATKEVVVGSQNVIDVSLSIDVTQLSEIVVTGYGEQSKATITNSIVTVDAEPLQNIPAGGNAMNGLIGKVPGVNILQNDGRSGSTPLIQIRGGTTPGFGGDQPLFIVDGFIQNDIGAIDMNDVEEFTVLKDASAAAIYGAQAANGVVIVKTRSGQRGKLKVQLKYGYEFLSAERNKMQTLTPEEEVYYQRLGYLNYEDPLGYQFISGRPEWYSAVQPYDPSQTGYIENNASQLHWLDDVQAFGGLPDGWRTTVDPVTGRRLAFPVNDWLDHVFTNGSGQNYFVNVGGGTDKATYSVSTSYYDQSGIGVFNDYKRYYLNANAEFHLADNFATGLNFNYNIEDENRGEGNPWYRRSGHQTITTRIYNEDGSPAPNFKNSSKWNPEYYESNLERARVSTNIRLNLFMDWEIIEGLSFKPSLLLSQGTTNFGSIIFENQIQGARRPQEASIMNTLNTQFSGVFNYDRTFNQVHNLGVLAGSEFRNGYDYLVSGDAFGAPNDYIKTISPTIPVENSSIRSSYVPTAIQSWFGRATYNYAMRYLFNVSLRYDGHYRFTEDNKWGTFPSISAGWNLHNENFWQGSIPSFIPRAKLKVGYGEAGKASNLSINDTQGAFISNSYANTGGVLQSTLQNSDLVWETTQETNLGLETTLLNSGNLDFSIEYYNRTAVDRLFLEPLPSYTGFTGIRTNVGNFESKGVEISYNWRILNTDAISWSLSGFFDFYLSQKTTKLPDNGAEKNRIGGTFITNPDDPEGESLLVGGFAEGERWGAIFGYVMEGVLQNWDQADEYNNRVFDEIAAGSRNTRQFKKPGDIAWADLNGDGLINSLDREFKGWSTPDKRIGLTQRFEYRSPGYGDFRLSFTLEGALGAVADDWHTMRAISQAQGGDRVSIVVRDSWLEEGDLNYARYTWANRHTAWNYERGAEPFMQSTDYLALRNLEFGYSLPESISKRIGMQDFEVLVSGYNLGYLTNYKGLDPAQIDGENRLDDVPPAPATLKLGVNVTF